MDTILIRLFVLVSIFGIAKMCRVVLVRDTDDQYRNPNDNTEIRSREINYYSGYFWKILRH